MLDKEKINKNNFIHFYCETMLLKIQNKGLYLNGDIILHLKTKIYNSLNEDKFDILRHLKRVKKRILKKSIYPSNIMVQLIEDGSVIPLNVTGVNTAKYSLRIILYYDMRLSTYETEWVVRLKDEDSYHTMTYQETYEDIDDLELQYTISEILYVTYLLSFSVVKSHYIYMNTLDDKEYDVYPM